MNLYFCPTCQWQIEFLVHNGRCKGCFREKRTRQNYCQQCQEYRLYDRALYLFDSLSPVMSLLQSRQFAQPLANLFVVALDHYFVDLPTRIISNEKYFKDVALEMAKILSLKRKNINNRRILILGQKDVERGYLEKQALKASESLILMLLQEPEF